jgi:hypothetical protein
VGEPHLNECVGVVLLGLVRLVSIRDSYEEKFPVLLVVQDRGLYDAHAICGLNPLLNLMILVLIKEYQVCLIVLVGIGGLAMAEFLLEWIE